MKETFSYIADFIRIDFLIGFGLYSILFFLIRLFKAKKGFLTEFDRSACSITIYAGITFAILWLTGILIHYFQITEDLERIAYLQRIIGEYWFGFWLQPLFWILLTQLLRINAFRKSLIYRLVMSLLFVFSFERVIIIITSVHRDYLSKSWSLDLTPFEITLGLTTKTILFILIASGFHFGRKRLKVLYSAIYNK
ncbi:hypothetical protein QQ008_11365 [Fulvivirgaceae bacterium BMA10]|uniref:Uncharacterized protein n=1 Tax=Splendidivirga corallicola TaxID=3051826 RepID=A0ABT8KML0_9BACT|nr:hypothetical protein [Fulvivirgaceae bacterium BMA10]